MGPVSVLIKPASGSCDLRCRYCFYCDETARRAEPSRGVMSAETLERVIKKSLRAADGRCAFAFQGGEPTLAGLGFFRAAVELEKSYNGRGLAVSNAIQTNGYALTAEWARFFAENGFLVGLSLDGTPQTHDRFRRDAAGAPTAARVLAAAKLLQQAGADFNILTVVNAATAPAAADIYRFYREQGFAHLQFIPCLDDLDGAPQEWSLTPQAYGDFLCGLFDCWEPDDKKNRAPSVRLFDNWFAMLRGLPPEECGMCGRCAAQYVVEADGAVYPCDFYALDEWRMGSFCTDTAAQLDEARARLGFLEQSYPVPEDCRACPWYPLCRNGCRRARQGGKYRFCESYRAFFTYAGDRLAAAAQRAAKRR